jgi:hypothetical protein
MLWGSTLETHWVIGGYVYFVRLRKEVSGWWCLTHTHTHTRTHTHTHTHTRTVLPPVPLLITM